MREYVNENWERLLFRVVGLIFLGFSFRFLLLGLITGASVTFVMSLLSFIFSNLARFKRFKGLGFEAELWEDKQKEAADLIDRLQSVVSIYTREVVLGQVMRGRFNGGDGGWKSHWKLFDELVSQHDALGQQIDFSDLKQKLDSVFAFDMAMPCYETIRRSIADGKANARKVINKEFGITVTDVAGFGKKFKLLSSIPEQIEDPFIVSQKGDLAGTILEWANNVQTSLKSDFGIEIAFDNEAVENLRLISNLRKNGAIEVTDQLIALTVRQT